jgi:hypothetical protein
MSIARPRSVLNSARNLICALRNLIAGNGVSEFNFHLIAEAEPQGPSGWIPGTAAGPTGYRIEYDPVAPGSEKRTVGNYREKHSSAGNRGTHVAWRIAAPPDISLDDRSHCWRDDAGCSGC